MNAKVRNETAPAAYADEGEQLVARALEYLTAKHCGADRPEFIHPASAGAYACLQVGALQSEHFCAAFLDNRHRLIAWEVLTTGSIDGASVYPREVVRRVLHHNAAAVIFAHNHPSGITEPSVADRDITRRLRDALALIDVRVLDHFVVAGGAYTSLAERGWI